MTLIDPPRISPRIDRLITKFLAISAAILTFAAIHRAIVVAILSVLSSASISLAVTSSSFSAVTWYISFAITIFLIVLAGTARSRYEAIPFLTFMLPTIFKVLELRDGDRITVHHIRNARRRIYEQLTEYFPATAMPTRGRRFSFTHGIVGYSFLSLQSLCWSIPEGAAFEDAIRHRWGFSVEEIARLSHDRRSYMAYPIGQEGMYAQAVLYLDSHDSDRFSKQNHDRYKALLDEYFVGQLNTALRRL